MMKTAKKTILSAILLLLNITIMVGRSIHRKIDPTMPCITAQWQGSKRRYIRVDSHYEEYPIFSCEPYIKDMIDNHLLSKDIIIDNSQTGHIMCGSILNDLLEELLQEIYRKKRIYKHFIVLQDKNFNRRKKCGLLVLKFKNHPFVVKLFIESPRTFLDPFCKGFEPIFLYYMSGGTNRHVAGLTRITNRKHILKWAQSHADWKGNIAIPRKWFWLPKQCLWIELHGKNIGGKSELHTVLPGTYALITDYIDTKDQENVFGNEQNSIIMDLCNELDMFVDPHVNNFIIKKNPSTGKPSVTIIDTEHFPTMIGLKQKTFFADHVSWITYMAGKCLEDIYFRPKSSRIKAQKKIHNLSLKK